MRMSYGVMAYAVDIDKLKALCGSGDNQTRRAVCGRFRADISRSNDWFDLSGDRGAPNIFTAIEHLIMGNDKTLDGYLYGYGFKYIVEFSGRMLDNGPFYPCPSGYLSDTVDPAIRATGADLSTSDLIFGGAPVAFPSPDDFPAIGHWTADEVAAADEPLRAAGADAIEEVRTVAGWVTHATGRSQGIVGFYH
jgi:hypothetical protein